MDDQPQPESPPESPTESLLACFAEHGVREFLRELDETDLVVASDAVLAELDRLDDPAFTARTTSFDEVPPDAAAAADRVVVWSLDDEREQVRQLRREFPDTRVHGLVGDLLPRLAAGRPADAEARPAANGYAIVCTPRTGSYHLCALLAAIGLGQPGEHLDQGLCTAARGGALDLAEYFDRLRGHAVAHGWFGTKLISHALFAAFDSGWPAPDFLAWLHRRRLRIVHLVRDDAAARAVSNYFARHTGIWSTTDDGPAPARPGYDFAAILSDWRELRQQDRWLEEFVRHLPEPALRVRYEDLDADPERVLRDVVAFLTDGGAAPLPFRVAPRTKKQRDAVSADYVRRFAAELEARGLT